MTTDSWNLATRTDLQLSGIMSGKAWNGGDGKYSPLPFQRQLQWNAYSMVHRAFRIARKVSASTNWTYVKLTPDGNYGPEPLLLTKMSDGMEDYSAPFGSVATDFTPYWPDEQEYKLLSKLLKKVKGHTHNVGVSLAEVDKFSSGILSTVKQFGFGMADLASGRFESFARRFGTYPPHRSVTRKLRTLDVSGRFLEMRYAWQPAIQDAYEAAKAFEAISSGPRKVFFKTSTKDDGYRKQTLFEGSWTTSRWVRVLKRSYLYEASEELDALRQIGLGNPASILWERIPYSFVVDWFLPIGTYLELIGQIPYLKGRFLRTSSVEYIFDGYSQLKTAGGFTCLEAPPIAGSLFKMWREPLAGLSVPFPSVKTEGAVQGKRLQNALALTHQIFANAATFLTGRGKLARNGRIRFEDDGINRSLLAKLGRF